MLDILLFGEVLIFVFSDFDVFGLLFFRIFDVFGIFLETLYVC